MSKSLIVENILLELKNKLKQGDKENEKIP